MNFRLRKFLSKLKIRLRQTHYNFRLRQAVHHSRSHKRDWGNPVCRRIKEPRLLPQLRSTAMHNFDIWINDNSTTAISRSIWQLDTQKSNIWKTTTWNLRHFYNDNSKLRYLDSCSGSRLIWSLIMLSVSFVVNLPKVYLHFKK